jgi:glycosyltransferase involved in cell wall biosynthesis
MVSLIVASLNTASTIQRCLDSIANQTFDDFELLVVDGGSTDSTVQTLVRYGKVFGPKLFWTSEPDQNLAEAWNKAVKRATGQWLLFLGADDSLSAPEILNRIVARLKLANPIYSVAYGAVAMTNAEGRIVEWRNYTWSPTKFRHFVENLPHSGVFHHRSLFARYGPFDSSFGNTLDYEFLLRALAKSEPLSLSGIVVANSQIGGVSTDHRRKLQAIEERIHIARFHMGRLPPIMYWWIAKTFASWLIFRLGGERIHFLATNLYRQLISGRPRLQR